MDLSSMSTFNALTHEYLYLLGPRADSILVDNFDGSDSINKLVWRFRELAAMSADDLTGGARAPGDPEDRLLFTSVFLWKQRHGFVDPRARLKCDLTGLRAALVHQLHSYMVASGYDGILQGSSQYTNIGFQYLALLGTLVEKWRSALFTSEEETCSEFVALLNVVGPQLETYEHRSDILDFSEAVIRDYKIDARYRCFSADDDLARLAQLFSDLRLLPDLTWPVFADLLLTRTKRSTEIYPALIAGLGMYGKAVHELLGRIELQGGRELLLSLMSER